VSNIYLFALWLFGLGVLMFLYMTRAPEPLILSGDERFSPLLIGAINVSDAVEH